MPLVRIIGKNKAKKYLRPTTFKETMGINPLQMLMSIVSLSGSIRIASDAMNKRTAMQSWVKRKNRGAAVVLRTHLLLQLNVSYALRETELR